MRIVLNGSRNYVLFIMTRNKKTSALSH
jgi:hypothetical protein